MTQSTERPRIAQIISISNHSNTATLARYNTPMGAPNPPPALSKPPSPLSAKKKSNPPSSAPSPLTPISPAE